MVSVKMETCHTGRILQQQYRYDAYVQSKRTTTMIQKVIEKGSEGQGPNLYRTAPHNYKSVPGHTHITYSFNEHDKTHVYNDE